jgi:hypothetical protein
VVQALALLGYTVAVLPWTVGITSLSLCVCAVTFR